MRSILKARLIAVYILVSTVGFSQTGIKAHVADKESGKPLLNTVVVLLKNGIETAQTFTDSSGVANFRVADTGMFDVRVICSTYFDYLLKGVLIKHNMITHVEIQMHSVTYIEPSYHYGNVCTLGGDDKIKEGSLGYGNLDSTAVRRLPSNDLRYILDFYPLK